MISVFDLYTFRFLLQKGADRDILNDEDNRPMDLVDPLDHATVSVILDSSIGPRSTRT